MLKFISLLSFLSCCLFFQNSPFQLLSDYTRSFSNETILGASLVGDGTFGVTTVATAVTIKELSAWVFLSPDCTGLQVFTGFFGLPCMVISCLACTGCWCLWKHDALCSRISDSGISQTTTRRRNNRHITIIPST